MADRRRGRRHGRALRAAHVPAPPAADPYDPLADSQPQNHHAHQGFQESPTADSGVTDPAQVNGDPRTPEPRTSRNVFEKPPKVNTVRYVDSTCGTCSNVG